METRYRLKWRLGVRTATALVKLGSKYSSTIALRRPDGALVSAKELMNWVLLDLRLGSPLSLVVAGADAAAARRELSEFFTCGEPQPKCPAKGCDAPPTMIEHGADPVYACANAHWWTAADPRPRKSA